MKILLTGSSGFLGKIILEKLNCEQQVQTLGRSSSNHIQVNSFDEICQLQPPERSPETIIHVAGLAHINPKNDEDLKLFNTINYGGTKNLCQWIDGWFHKPKSFVFISSVSVYGLDHGEEICENNQLNGNTPYAKSKINAEHFLIEWGKKNGIKVLILRLPLIVGSNPRGNLGRMINAIHNGTYLRIGKGNARKSMVLATDVASLISNWINNPIAPSGTYNLTDGYHPSFYEVEEAIKFNAGKNRVLTIPLFLAKLLGKTGDLFSFFPINSGTVQKITTTCTFSDEKARNELKWNPSSVLSFWEE